MPCPTCPSTSTTDVLAHLRDQCVADSTPLKYLQGFRSKARREHPRAALICQVFHKVTLPWRSKSYAIVVFTWHLTWNSKNLRQTQSTKCCFVPSSIYITSMRFLSSETKGFQTIGWYVFFVILRVQFPSLICIANTLQFGTVGKGANKNKEKTISFFAAWKNGKQSRNPQKQHQIAWVVPILKEMKWIHVVPILVRISN